MTLNDIPEDIRRTIREGTVIPAHPLALTEERCVDSTSMRALTRYYIDAGVGGLAVGVHSTQFEIRDRGVDLLEAVLKMTSETIDDWAGRKNRRVGKIAGVCGKTDQALAEAELARSLGYHACLLSLSALSGDPVPDLVDHCRKISEVMPLIGFYLQPAVGGRALPSDFWRRFSEIENVLAIKISPFNRYQTLDVIRGVCDAGREEEISLYTGNDDNIVADLLTPFTLNTLNGMKTVRMVGGLLGHWCVWTKKAVELLDEIRRVTDEGPSIPAELLARGVQITDANAAFFDSAHDFAGCIPGIHEVLRRQGLMENTLCLNPDERLSPGQREEIDRVYAGYPHLNDDDFVHAHLAEWKAP